MAKPLTPSGSLALMRSASSNQISVCTNCFPLKLQRRLEQRVGGPAGLVDRAAQCAREASPGLRRAELADP